MAVAQGTKLVKKASASKTAKSSPSHPPYIQMITDALVALKERSGSSHYAIAKHIEEEQKVKDLPANFKKILSVQLKRCVASGKLVMIKKSFKLPPKAPAAKPAADTAKPKAAKPSTEKKAVKSVKSTKPKAATKSSGKSSLKVVKSPMKKSGATPVKAKKPKSIKSSAKKAATKVKKAAPAAAKKAKK